MGKAAAPASTCSPRSTSRCCGSESTTSTYSHRFDPQTPSRRRHARTPCAAAEPYVGIRPTRDCREAAAIARELGTPLVIHQPSYSMLNRWIETDLLDALADEGMGCIVFTALAQGLLTDRYLDGIPADSRAARTGSSIGGGHLTEATLTHLRGLNEIAAGRGQQLAQLALQWALRDPRVTSAVIGASSVAQLDTNLDALAGPALTAAELSAIDEHAVESGINLWAAQTSD